MKRILTAAVFFTLVPVITTVSAADDAANTSISALGDAEAGRVAFFKCKACHNLDVNKPHGYGPNLDNIFGRMAGTSKGYNGYSKALKESGIVWTEKTLDQWLKDPQNFLPGNKMPFAGVRSEQERRNLIAYLREATKK